MPQWTKILLFQLERPKSWEKENTSLLLDIQEMLSTRYKPHKSSQKKELAAKLSILEQSSLWTEKLS